MRSRFTELIRQDETERGIGEKKYREVSKNEMAGLSWKKYNEKVKNDPNDQYKREINIFLYFLFTFFIFGTLMLMFLKKKKNS